MKSRRHFLQQLSASALAIPFFPVEALAKQNKIFDGYDTTIYNA